MLWQARIHAPSDTPTPACAATSSRVVPGRSRHKELVAYTCQQIVPCQRSHANAACGRSAHPKVRASQQGRHGSAAADPY